MTALLLALLPQAVELDYRPAIRPEEREGVVDLLRKRLATGGFAGATVAAEPDGLLRVVLPGAGPEQVLKAKRLLAPRGLLELRATADRAMQEQFNEDGVVPEGWEALKNPKARLGPEYATWGETILLRKRSAIGDGRIVGAHAESALVPGTKREWYVTFDLDAAGAKGLDATAKELYQQRPPGQLAIVLDGRVHSTPAVQTETFAGRGRVMGVGGEDEAKALAVVLGLPPLPAVLGAPEAERRR